MATRDFGTDLYVQKGTLVPGKRWNKVDIEKTIKDLLGQNMVVDESGQFSADNYFSATDSRHGLHFTIRGRAENVMVDIATHLAQFTDPINLVLGKRITRNYKVVVTRHEMMGGRVEQVPERAPARLVTSREVKTEVELARYGNDVTIDTNLLASPEDFAADVNRKVTFQKQQFQQKLIELGYECLMNESTNLIPALARSIPIGNLNAAYAEAYKRYMNDCFGAFNYYKNPGGGPGGTPTNKIAKILQHVRMAATATAAPMTVMIVPAGADLQGYQREPNAQFNVTGIKQNELAPVTFPLPSVVTDPTTNLQIGVSYPLMSYDRGTRNPQAMGSSGLTETIYVYIEQDNSTKGATDKTFKGTTNWGIHVPPNRRAHEILSLDDFTDSTKWTETIEGNDTTGKLANVQLQTFFFNFIKAKYPDDLEKDSRVNSGAKITDGPGLKTALGNKQFTGQYTWGDVYFYYMELKAVHKLVTSSAIIAAPGPDTGEMLVAYPQTTAHSVEVAPEEMKMQMRAYLGAAIYNSANVIRIPHVLIDHFEETATNLPRDVDFDQIMVMSKDQFKLIFKKITGKNDTDTGKAATAATHGAFVDSSAATSGGGGVAPSSSGDVARKKKTPKA